MRQDDPALWRENDILLTDARPPARYRGTAVVSGLASDAHTWNLVYLQLLLTEHGYHVVNLGPCVPDEMLVEQCRRIEPALVAIGSVNGHGRTDGLRVIATLRASPELADTPIVIGGKLTVSDDDVAESAQALVAAGFDAVFPDRASNVAEFAAFVTAIPATASLVMEAG
jgi:methylaspartate mutase sigma subunit